MHGILFLSKNYLVGRIENLDFVVCRFSRTDRNKAAITNCNHCLFDCLSFINRLGFIHFLCGGGGGNPELVSMPFASSSMQPVSFDPLLDGDDEGIIADNPTLEPAENPNADCKAKNSSILGNMDIFKDFFLAAFSDGYYNVREIILTKYSTSEA